MSVEDMWAIILGPLYILVILLVVFLIIYFIA